MAHGPDMPPVTDAHRQRAYVHLRITSHTYEQAMADTKLHRLIESCAATLRKREWQTRNTKGVRVAPRHINFSNQD